MILRIIAILLSVALIGAFVVTYESVDSTPQPQPSSNRGPAINYNQ